MYGGKIFITFMTAILYVHQHFDIKYKVDDLILTKLHAHRVNPIQILQFV